MTSIANVNSIKINSSSRSGYGPFYSNKKIVSVDLGGVPWTNNSMVNAFNNCNKLTSVTDINDNVLNMHSTFAYCNDLVNAPKLSNSAVHLGYTFYSCQNLVNAPTIPSFVNDMTYTFGLCYKLVNPPLLPNSVSHLYRTFYSCNSLSTAPVIPNSVINIEGAFSGCKNLTSAPVIPSSVYSVAYAFQSCTNISGDVYVYSSTIAGASGMFNNTTTPKNVYIPYNVSLGIYTDTYNAFNAVGYKPSVIQHGVTIKETPDFAVYNNDWWACGYDGVIHKYLLTQQTQVTVPGTINGKQASINLANFSNKYSLTTTMTTLNLNNAMVTNMAEAFAGASSVINVVTGINTNSICVNMANAFASCRNLTSISSVPGGIKTLFRGFIGCYKLQSLPTFPDTIEDYYLAFDACNGLTTAPIISSNAKNVSRAFSGCNSLSGNVYIKSNKITSAVNCFNITSPLRKNVYIPFKNSDGTNSATYNSFIAAGYKTDGSYQNVYLTNWTPT